jgi:hypothetical protein
LLSTKNTSAKIARSDKPLAQKIERVNKTTEVRKRLNKDCSKSSNVIELNGSDCLPTKTYNLAHNIATLQETKWSSCFYAWIINPDKHG